MRLLHIGLVPGSDAAQLPGRNAPLAVAHLQRIALAQAQHPAGLHARGQDLASMPGVTSMKGQAQEPERMVRFLGVELVGAADEAAVQELGGHVEARRPLGRGPLQVKGVFYYRAASSCM
jgi:hypothetical protein